MHHRYPPYQLMFYCYLITIIQSQNFVMHQCIYRQTKVGLPVPYMVRPVQLHKTGNAIFHKNTASQGVRSMPITCINIRNNMYKTHAKCTMYKEPSPLHVFTGQNRGMLCQSSPSRTRGACVMTSKSGDQVQGAAIILKTK